MTVSKTRSRILYSVELPNSVVDEPLPTEFDLAGNSVSFGGGVNSSSIVVSLFISELIATD